MTEENLPKQFDKKICDRDFDIQFEEHNGKVRAVAIGPLPTRQGASRPVFAVGRGTSCKQALDDVIRVVESKMGKTS